MLESPGFAEYLAGVHVVRIDVGDWDHNLDVSKRYGDPITVGIPAVVLVSPDGVILGTTADGRLASAASMTPDAVLAVLSPWAGRRVAASPVRRAFVAIAIVAVAVAVLAAARLAARPASRGAGVVHGLARRSAARGPWRRPEPCARGTVHPRQPGPPPVRSRPAGRRHRRRRASDTGRDRPGWLDGGRHGRPRRDPDAVSHRARRLLGAVLRSCPTARSSSSVPIARASATGRWCAWRSRTWRCSSAGRCYPPVTDQQLDVPVP